MLLIIKKVFFLVGLTLFVINAHSQIVFSTRNGVWTDPATWLGGIVPSSVNATQIIIDHEVELQDSLAVSVFRMVVNNTLTLKAGAALEILPDALPNVPDLQVAGTLVCQDSALLSGTSSLNTVFESGAEYVHQQGPLGFIPYATWDKNATFVIAGFRASGYINIAHSDSWKQTFGNVVYDCPQQTIFVVDLNGYLRNIVGNFTIKNTNNQALRLSTTQNPVINIGGDLVVEGLSEVWFSTTGIGSVVNIAGDFKYKSISSGSSYFTTRGSASVNVFGNMELDSPGPIRMTSSSIDSAGTRMATLSLYGDLRITSGNIIAPPLGSGTAKIVFNGNGTEIQSVTTPAGGPAFQGNLEYVVEEDARVDLGVSVLSNTSGMLLVRGRLLLGSTHPLGAIQVENNGNIQVQGTRVFENGSSIEYNGTTSQTIGNGHPASLGVDLICNNASGITVLQEVVIGGNFYLNVGSFQAAPHALTVYGDLIFEEGAVFQSETVRLLGNRNQEVSTLGVHFKNLSINKSEASTVKLLSPLSVEGVVLIESQGTVLESDGNLTLLSTTDQALGNATVGTIPDGSGVVGDVTVQRYMSGEGRIYRYISSPVQNATVGSLMDDFPITGTFADPSTGSGIKPKAPSFYFYDESVGGLQEGWKPYPTSGLADMSPLEIGRGYAAFIRNGVDPTVWDVSGNLNQGEISLPVAFTPNGAPSNGWNLVGNPYSCTIDWDVAGADGWTKQHISNVISIRDNGVEGSGTFHYWDGDINYSDIPDGQIASGQSMWVRATDVDPMLIIREGTKVNNGAAFYRNKPAYIPSFALILKRGVLEDRVYFKVRENAREGLDDWDALKMDNENFDISILSSDSVSMAIDATNQFPCISKTIQLVLKDLTGGIYSFSLVTKFDFENYTYTVADRYLQQETVVSSIKDFEFVVTDDPASSLWNRFALRLDELIPDVSLKAISPAVVCAGAAAPVLINYAQAGMHYAIWTDTGKQLSGEEIGKNADIVLEVTSDSLQSGTYSLVVIARSVCAQVQLLTNLPITIEPAIILSVASASGCVGSLGTYSVSSENHDLTYSWFDTQYSLDTLAQKDQFTTTLSAKREVYFVSGTSPGGCVSKRYPVMMDNTIYDSAKITWVDDVTLSSNSTVNNQWYLNGKILALEVDQKIRLTSSGVFSLLVELPGCITSDSVVVDFENLEPGKHHPVNLFPNPVTNYLYLQSPFDAVENVKIVDMMGMLVDEVYLRDSNTGTGESVIDTSILAAGVYFAVITGSATTHVIRFCKID